MCKMGMAVLASVLASLLLLDSRMTSTPGWRSSKRRSSSANGWARLAAWKMTIRRLSFDVGADDPASFLSVEGAFEHPAANPKISTHRPCQPTAVVAVLMLALARLRNICRCFPAKAGVARNPGSGVRVQGGQNQDTSCCAIKCRRTLDAKSIGG